jgi:hypothetical protein
MEEQECRVNMKSLNTSFLAIEHPELVYKTSREMQKAAYSSALLFLFIAATIQNSTRFDHFQFSLFLGCSVSLTLLSSIIFLVRGYLFFMNAEFDRRANGILFANSVLALQSDEAYSNYRMHNIRIFRTHNSGPYLPYIVLIVMAVSLFAVQIIFDSSGEPLTDNTQLLFGPIISGYLSIVILVAMIILGTGIFGMAFRLFSDAGVNRWNSKSTTQMNGDAEKLVSKYSRRGKKVKMTYEEAAKLLRDSENGDPEAVQHTRIMTEGIDREIARFRKLKIIYTLAIILVSIIDLLVSLLP